MSQNRIQFDNLKQLYSKLHFENEQLKKQIEAAEAKNERLWKDAERLWKDAERYRWLRRSNSNGDLPYLARDCFNSWGKLVTRELRNSSADKAIDKAMGAK